jgi:hypothetical protein
VRALPEWQVVELTSVTEEDLTALINEQHDSGWQFERADYIKETGIRRPQMAFVHFRRDRETT